MSTTTAAAALQRPVAAPAATSLLRELFAATPLGLLIKALSSTPR